MKKNHTEELLKDAQLVTDFASRVGLLEQPNDPLIEETHQVKKQLKNPELNIETDIHLGKLYIALSRAVKNISPYVSLCELKEGYSPFGNGKSTQYISGFILIAFFIISLVSTIFLIQRLQADLTITKKFSQAQKMNLDDQVKNISLRVLDGSVSDINSSGFDSYQKSLQTARVITSDYKFIVFYALDNDASVGAKILSYLVLQQNDQKQQYNSVNPAVYMGANNQVNKNISYSDLENAYNWKSSGNKPVINNLIAEPNCDALFNSKSVKLNQLGVKAIDQFELIAECIVKKYKLAGKREKESVQNIIERRTIEIYLLTAWLLPLCAGMLGAAVYLIYTYYFDQIRPPGSALRMMLRFIIGGIGGLIIGWFYSPARYSGNEIDLINSIKQFPFMFAFLAGFSSEYAFSYITKLVTVSKSEKNE